MWQHLGQLGSATSYQSARLCARGRSTQVTRAGPDPEKTDVEIAQVTSTWPLAGVESSWTSLDPGRHEILSCPPSILRTSSVEPGGPFAGHVPTPPASSPRSLSAHQPARGNEPVPGPEGPLVLLPPAPPLPDQPRVAPGSPVQTPCPDAVPVLCDCSFPRAGLCPSVSHSQPSSSGRFCTFAVGPRKDKQRSEVAGEQVSVRTETTGTGRHGGML